MNADTDIDKIEQFILGGINPKEENPRRRLIIACTFFGFLAVISLSIAYSQVPQIENIDNHYFYLILTLIPLISILTIRRMAKNIRKANYRKKPYRAVGTMITIAVLAGVLLPMYVNRNFSPDTILIVDFIVFMVLGLVSVLFVSALSYAVYLMYKYAPYFKDERLRRDK